MLSQTFKINTMEDYLAYFVNKVNEPIFSTSLPIVKERILEICRELEEEIDGINKENFFQRWATINSLESPIWILLELSEVTAKKGKTVFTEEEVVITAKEDCRSYFKEKCGMTLLDETPHSLHFSID